MAPRLQLGLSKVAFKLRPHVGRVNPKPKLPKSHDI